MSAHPMIHCESLVKIYRLDAGSGSDSSPEVQALQGLDLIVEAGEMVGVVGASGSGKSTLLNILGGLDSPTGGRALVDDHDLGRMNQSALDDYRRRTVGFVWQQGSRNLLPYLTASENIRLPMTLSGQANRNIRERASSLLDVVGLSDRSEHKLYELSGGEQQRVAVAIAIANQPRLLLTDEPTGELDNDTARMVYDLLRDLNKKFGLTILIVSHDVGISRHVDRVVAVRDGKLASETVRVTVQSDEGHAAHHYEEHVILDSAGRVQIPRDYLEALNIHRRARIEMTDAGILIKPPDKAHQETRHATSPETGNEIEVEEDEELETLPWYKRFTQSISTFLKRIFKKGSSGSPPGEDVSNRKDS